MSDVVWAKAALDDFDSIITYIAGDDPRAARRVADRIGNAAASLGRTPTGRPGRVAGTYEKSVVGLPYVIAYAFQAISGKRERIVILRVIHSARNWPKGKWPK